MGVQYLCTNEERRRLVSDPARKTNGIDYLEVAADQKTLKVCCFHNLPGQQGAISPNPQSILNKDNVVVEGGTRVRDIRVESASSSNNVLTVVVNKRGDFSTYRLRLVAPTEPVPPPGFDPQLSEIEFSFDADSLGEFDCKVAQVGPEPAWPVPQIDYLAKDYASFRRLMLDRLALIMPDWQERNPADLGVVLVELLAYAADHLSYYQDAVGTEAYLGTARRRVSARRHARLLDYPMHDGCNARAWVTLEIGSEADGEVLPGPSKDQSGSMLLTQIDAPRAAVEDVPPVAADTEVFETLHNITLRTAHNRMYFYTWGDKECCLPKGATRATLRDYLNPPERLSLRPGDVLVFEEVKGQKSGSLVDADPSRRHAVRLTKVSAEDKDGEPLTDPLYDQAIAEIEWHTEDALPFPLCISARTDEEHGREYTEGISVVRGNVVLADHGHTVPPEKLDELPREGRYRPKLKVGPLTQQGHARDRLGRLVLDQDERPVRFDPKAPASAAMHWEMRDVLPAIELREDQDATWRPQRDLLTSDRFAAEFVVETEDDGGAFLRFGDGVMGRQLTGDLKAFYRVGNGRTGNIGAEAITHLVVDPEHFADPETAGRLKRGIEEVRNPLPAQGGTDSEPIEQVRLHAPHAFRTQERAVTEADYEAVAQRHPEVQRAAATRRWTGSWYTWFITVDRKEGRPVDVAFEHELRAFLERFRLAGYDLEVDAPRFVPLDIALTVSVAPGYISGNVKQALLGTFSNAELPDGRRGFFHQDGFTFGQSVYLSQMIAAAMKVSGVIWVKPVRFQRWGEEPHGELEDGRINFDRLEIARLDNDSRAPDNGKLEFYMEGSL